LAPENRPAAQFADFERQASPAGLTLDKHHVLRYKAAPELRVPFRGPSKGGKHDHDH
jgi:hypothetical protein